MRETILDQGNIRAGPAHIKANHFRQPELLAIKRRAIHATGRSRQNGLHGQASGIVKWRDTAVGLHDEHLAQRRQPGQTLLEMAQILAEHRANICIDHGRAEPVEFFNLRQDFMRE